jgi:hypothetical protein
MRVVVGPVVTRDGGFAFDSWTPQTGLGRGYSYRRIEDAHYARKVQIKAAIGRPVCPMVACDTIDEFISALAGRIESAAMAGHL